MRSPRWFRRVFVAAAFTMLVAACADGGVGGLATDDHPPPPDTVATEADDEHDPQDAVSEAGRALPPGGAQFPPDTEVDPDEGLDDPVVAVADLAGGHVVPGPGAAGTTGRFELVAASDEEFCVDLVVENAPPGTNSAHLHVGAAGEAGPIAVDLTLDSVQPATTEEAIRWSDVCQPAEPSLIESLVVSTDAYYVQVHSDDYPEGAVRGQLTAASLFDLELS